MKAESPRRRQLLQLAGIAPVLLLPGRLRAAAGQCAQNIEATVGPYPNIDALNRPDIRASTAAGAAARAGGRLDLRIRVLDVGKGCMPLAGAVVDIWGADGRGVYSGYRDFNTASEDFLRGYQVTDERGEVAFTTVVPGCYPGRAVHIHMAVQAAARNLRPRSHGSSLADVYVTQLYFQRAMMDEVFRTHPVYGEGARFVPNESDYNYREEGGSRSIVEAGRTPAGYSGRIDVSLQRSSIGL